MTVKRMMLTGLAIMIAIAFGNFVQKTYSAEEPNAPAEKERKVERSKKVERRATEQRVKQRMAELSAELNLTDKQQKAIRPIVEKEIKEIQELRADPSVSKGEKIEKMRSLRQTAREEIEKLLTPEQQEKLAGAKEEMKEDAKENVSQAAQQRRAILSERLNLTDEQKQKIAPIIENELKEISEARNDESLSKEQKFEKMKAIRQRSREEIKKVLTSEQQAKFEEVKEKGRNSKKGQRITDGNDRY